MTVRTIGGIPVEVTRKRMKNMRLRVLPEGRVCLSAPYLMPNAMIDSFVLSRKAWLLQVLAGYQAQAAMVSKDCETIFGCSYRKQLLDGAKNAVNLSGDAITVVYRTGADPEQLLKEYERALLKQSIDALLPLWESKTGLKSAGYTVRDMKSRWGSCNTNTAHLNFNLRLIHYPKACLEYVILHELTHIRYPDHGAGFKAFLTEYMPEWKSHQKQLNPR